ncbi:hypothetical protein P171DRAFT_5774 [Karstenula rhodostoma CBS 690.94]|uniref:Signal peptide-containing protein n=1 Tax=Karstenula rhodostoma CBS 690.94 TaxID=1392251 RepID=A0A9P4PYW6_9PLEO|nr:hypothetical protein P171DRAFT_5774 [Karstenula rhodostoma CBS 690.94]
MSWFMRGVQSAIFHYASCAPCTGYMYKKQRRKQAKQARKARTKLVEEQPELYYHPEPTGTNPYWQEEIGMGPGPPPRRAKRTTTCNPRATTTAGTNGSAASQTGSSMDVDRAAEVRLSDDTLDADNWNRKRYQREDEELWGFDTIVPLHTAVSGSSVGVTGLTRPSTSRSGSHYSVRAPPVNDLHPPVVSLPSPHAYDNQWMLQPPPKASVMSGKERATLRSRSGSGASSRVELSLQRQVSARQMRHKIDRGETPDMPSLSRGNSYNDMFLGQRHDRPKTPLTRPPSAASSYRPRTRRDTAMTSTSATEQLSSDSSDTVVRRSHSSSRDLSTVPSLHLVHTRSSRQQLSTVVSSGSDDLSTIPTNTSPPTELENENLRVAAIRKVRHSTQSTDSDPYHLMKRHTPLIPSDISSLNVLQNLVSPDALFNSRFVSAPLMEARIKLPPSDHDEQKMLDTDPWSGSGFAISRGWGTEQVAGEARVPFDSAGVAERDPRMRWSVDF